MLSSFNIGRSGSQMVVCWAHNQEVVSSNYTATNLKNKRAKLVKQILGLGLTLKSSLTMVF